MNLADLETEFWGGQREQPVRIRLERVLRALRDEANKGRWSAMQLILNILEGYEENEILGDAETATAGAIQPHGEESVRHISQEASPPETRRRAVAGPIEGPGNSAARDDQRSGTHPRAVAGEDKTGRGRHVGGEGHHGVTQDVCTWSRPIPGPRGSRVEYQVSTCGNPKWAEGHREIKCQCGRPVYVDLQDPANAWLMEL